MAAWSARQCTELLHHCCTKECALPQTVLDTSAYEDAPAGFVGRMRISLQTCANKVNLCAYVRTCILEKELGQIAYIVATKLLLVDALMVEHRRIALTLAATPTKEWVERETTALETIARNATHLEENKTLRHTHGEAPKTPNLKHMLVARIKTVLGRDMRHHDTTEEYAQRTSVTIPHAYDTAHYSGCDCWHQELYNHLQRYTAEAVGSAPSRPQSASDWWAARCVWLGNGTSSQSIKNMPKHISAAMRENKQLRGTKALLCSHYPADWFRKQIEKRPVMICRSATKNEPGLKRRALRASDDGSYAVAAFASNNLEKYLSIQGSLMRQTPDDVKHTAARVSLIREGSMIACIDYSDFNQTHTIRARVYANLALAKSYTMLGQTEQAVAALWMARAHLNHYIDGHRVSQGLSSGERDTARDNTMLHNAYAHLARITAAASDPGWHSGAYTHMCGDDELVIGIDWDSAQSYINAHVNNGHTLSPRKILVSGLTAEFLQYNMYCKGNRLPTQPLSPALNNFVSGSWYKMSAYDKRAYPEQVTEAASSCIRRGGRADTFQELCINTVSWLCAGMPWKRMLLATKMYGSQPTQPSFIQTDTLACETILAGQAEASAISEYTNQINRRYKFASEENAAIKEYARDNVYGSMKADLRQKKHHSQTEDLAQRLPEAKTPKLPNNIFRTWILQADNPREESTTWLAVQLGLPPSVIAKIGFSKVIRACNNMQRRHVNVPPKQLMPMLQPEQLAQLPGAVASYFREAKMLTC